MPDVIVEGACKATDPSEIKATNETKVTTKRSKKGKPNTQEVGSRKSSLTESNFLNAAPFSVYRS